MIKNLVTLLVLTSGLFFVSAQEVTETFYDESAFLKNKTSRPEGAVNCFDYYTFGSVKVDLSPLRTESESGKVLTFKGVVKNTNPYPIVDGQVYVKIFRKNQTESSLVKINGYPIVDFFLVKDNIVIDGKTEQDIAFDWQVPKSAEGEYQAAFYFTSAHRYNLLGLSFTDDVTGNKANFSIKGSSGNGKSAVFDKNTVMLNDKEFHATAFLNHFTKDEEIVTTFVLKNDENKEKTVHLDYITSKWDGILSSNEVKRESSVIILKANEVKKILYTIPRVQSSVTFLQVESKDGDAKSILHIRFIRDGYEEIRTNFPGLLSYPLLKGKENTLFSCVHSTNMPIVEGGNLTLTLLDENNKIIHSYKYVGGITGEMMGVKDLFTLKKNYSTFSLHAKLEKKGEVIEEVTMKYDCNLINKNVCKSNVIFYILGTFAAMIIFTGFYLLRKKILNKK